MRRTALTLFAVSLVTLGTFVPAGVAQAAPRRQAVLVLVPGLSYQEALASPVLATLSRRGGLGLMTTAGATETRAAEFVTLGAGAVGGGPDRFEVRGVGQSIDVNVNPYLAASASATPGALAEALEEDGRAVAYFGPARGGAYALLTAMDEAGRVHLEGRGDLLVVVAERPTATVSLDDSVATALSLGLEHAGDGRSLVIVTSADASPEAAKRGDEVTPVVMATIGGDEEIEGGVPADRPIRGLASETTRIDGVVANVDIAPTILGHLRVAIPPSMTGSPIRIEGAAPTELHARYLDYRSSLRPVGVTALLLALAALVSGGAVLLFWRRSPRAVAAAFAIAGLAGVALQVALLPASYLPAFDLPLVLAALVAAAGVLTAAALLVGRPPSLAGAVAFVAGAGLALVALDAALGWRSLVTPLLGGGALDGVRFFGLGNSYAGVVMSGAVLVAALLPVWWGAALLVGAALFAGMPWVGADLGGGLTLFAVAGLWIGVRARGRFDGAAVAIAVATFVLGFAIIVGVHRLADEATHVTRATEGSGGWTAIIETFWRRLTLNIEATVATPIVWPALIGVPVWLVVAARRMGPFAASLDGMGAWRDAVVVLAVGGILGYVLNDTFGMASISFLYLSLAMVFPALAVRWKTA